ncbi:MAG: winged helix-turn-helix domain-containing protein [Dehalococcoidia bacterium]
MAVTPKEFDLLQLFMTHPGRAFHRDELIERIWDNDLEMTDRTIDTHIQRLRRKLGDEARRIQTVRGVGYKLDGAGEDTGGAGAGW